MAGFSISNCSPEEKQMQQNDVHDTINYEKKINHYEMERNEINL